MGAPDLSEFIGLSKPKKPPCQVGRAKEQLPTDEAAALQAACEQDVAVITTAAIRQWLAARGHDASVSGVTSHRKATCTCHG